VALVLEPRLDIVAGHNLAPPGQLDVVGGVVLLRAVLVTVWRLPPLLFLAVPEIGAGSGVGVSPTNSNGHQQHKESTHGTYDFRYL
jgi:hypothetical protein